MKHTILFFGIVINDSCDSSIPILEAFEKFKEFKLDVVPYEYIGIADSFDELCVKLKKLYVKIAESSIIDEEEGSVVYLSRTYASTFNSDKEYRKDDKILSLFKLKTWEYRVYRKLREKIKNNLLDQNFYSDSRRKISQFFEELRTMLQGFNLPMPFQFYYKVAETAFDFACKGDYLKALNLNGLIYAATLGFDSTIAIDALSAGAIASGLSGTGSAFVAVVREDSIDDVKESWEKYEGRVIETQVDNEGCCIL